MLGTQVFAVLLTFLLTTNASPVWKLAPGMRVVPPLKARQDTASEAPPAPPMTMPPSGVHKEDGMMMPESKPPMAQPDMMKPMTEKPMMPESPIPGLPGLPAIPGVPAELPSVPNVPSVPSIPSIPSIPQFPGGSLLATESPQEQPQPQNNLNPAQNNIGQAIQGILPALPTSALISPAEEGTFKPGAALAPEPLVVTPSPPPPKVTPSTPAPTPAPTPRPQRPSRPPPPDEEDEDDEDDEDESVDSDASESDEGSPEVPPRPFIPPAQNQRVPASPALVAQDGTLKTQPLQGGSSVAVPVPAAASSVPAAIPSGGSNRPQQAPPVSQQKPLAPRPRPPPEVLSEEEDDSYSVEDDDDESDSEEDEDSSEESFESGGRLDLPNSKQSSSPVLEEGEPLYISRGDFPVEKAVEESEDRIVLGTPIIAEVVYNKKGRPQLRLVEDIIRPGDIKVGQVLEHEGDKIIGIVPQSDQEELVAFKGPDGVVHPVENPVPIDIHKQGSNSGGKQRYALSSSSEEDSSEEQYDRPMSRSEPIGDVDAISGVNPLEYIYSILGRADGKLSDKKKHSKNRYSSKGSGKPSKKRPTGEIPYFQDSDKLLEPTGNPGAKFRRRRPNTPMGYPAVPFPADGYYPALDRAHMHYRNPYDRPFGFPKRRVSYVLGEDPAPPFHVFPDEPFHPSEYQYSPSGHFLGEGPGTSSRASPNKGLTLLRSGLNDGNDNASENDEDDLGNSNDELTRKKIKRKPLKSKKKKKAVKCPIQEVKWKNSKKTYCPLTKGPCPSNQWLVLSRSGRAFKCKRKKCSTGTMAYEGACYRKEDSELLCPGAEMRLYLNLHGEAYCDCKPNHYYWALDGHCYPAYSRGPCGYGYHIRLDTLRRQYPTCVRNPCFFDNLAYLHGKCHEIGNPTVCQSRNKQLQISPKTGMPECMLKKHVFQNKRSDKPCQLGSYQRINGCPTLYPARKKTASTNAILKDVIPALSVLLKAATQRI